jgi:hypothetical protein
MALIAFGLYRRAKRTIGFQKLGRSRLIFRTVLFGILGCIFLYLGLLHPINLAADGIGLLGGLILSYYAVKHLQFEKRDNGWYYRTHVWVEITVLALLISRIVYKLSSMYLGSPAAFQPGAATSLESFTKDPWTVGIFFVLISFYIRYFTHLLRKQKELDVPELHST